MCQYMVCATTTVLYVHTYLHTHMLAIEPPLSFSIFRTHTLRTHTLHTHTRTHTHTHTHTHTRTHARTHALTHTHSHTLPQFHWV